MKFLESIRSKPIHIRKRMLYVSTGLIFFVIITVWWNTWSIKGTGATVSPLADNTPVDTIGSMWRSAKDDIAGAWTAMIEEAEYSANQEAPIPEGVPLDANGDAPVYPEDVFPERDYGTTSEREATTTIN